MILTILPILLLGVLTQRPPYWGGNPRFTVNATMLNDNPAIRWNFTYFYDWQTRAARYEHQSPQADEMCVLPDTNFTKEGIPCYVTYASDGYSYIEFPTESFCCRCNNKFGVLRYDWLQEDSHYEGLDTIQGHDVTHWTKAGNTINHYYSTIIGQRPVRLFEIKKGNPKSWDFDVDTYSTGPIDLAKLRPQCPQRQCGGRCPYFGAQP